MFVISTWIFSSYHGSWLASLMHGGISKQVVLAPMPPSYPPFPLPSAHSPSPYPQHSTELKQKPHCHHKKNKIHSKKNAAEDHTLVVIISIFLYFLPRITVFKIKWSVKALFVGFGFAYNIAGLYLQFCQPCLCFVFFVFFPQQQCLCFFPNNSVCVFAPTTGPLSISDSPH